MPQILLVEDDQKLAKLIQEFLKDSGFDVQHIDRGDHAVYQILQREPDLVILDIMLPGLDGIQVCRSVRQNYQGAIIMLTAREDDDSHIEGLEVGADDYLQKPVDPKVLLAHIQMQLKRGKVQNDVFNQLSFGALEVDQSGLSVCLNGESIDLQPKEFQLLVLLAMNAGRVLSRDNISQLLRGIDYDGFDRTIDMYVSNLRKKLGDDGKKPTRIKSVWGKGYQFAPDAWA